MTNGQKDAADNTTNITSSESLFAEYDSDSRLATVLQVLPALVTGGVERGTVEVAGAIQAAGGRAIVVSNGGPMVHELDRVGAEHIELPVHSKNPLVMRANIDKLAEIIQREHVDIVHARSRAPAWSAFYAAKKTNAHFVTTFHGTYSHDNAFKRRYNKIMTAGEKVIAISSFIAGHMRKIYGVPNENIRVISRGVDMSRFDPDIISAERLVALAGKWRVPDGAPVVMLPGRLTRWKGQITFIEAIALLGRKDIRALLVGSDQGREAYRRELETLIGERGLNDVVRIVDHCDDMAAAYMLTDIVVSASTDPEAFGRVAIEAQSLGRPVVATNHGGAKETVVDGKTGWLVPPGEASAMADAIRKGLDLDDKAREAFSSRAIKNVHDNFSKETMCAKTLDVYNEVLHQELAGK
ncbi:MAG: glycosyltransferase family 4 protein [Rhodospirillales bacterium]|nr:glycosyltransferase family 4 protein [Rhodospirillales bacterium]